MSKFDRLQSEIETERAHLDASLAQLGERLSLRHITDEAAQKASDAGESLFDGVMRHVGPSTGPNTLANALVSAGVGWALRKLENPTPRQNYRAQGMYNGPKPAEGDPDLETRVYAGPTQVHPSTTDAIVEKSADALQAAQQQVREVRQQARDLRDRIAEGTEKLSDEARARVIAARERALDAADHTTRTVRKAGRQSAAFVQENPLIIGGIALTWGAAVAGALWWRKSDEDKGEATNAFEEADRVFEDELAKARLRGNSSVLGVADGEPGAADGSVLAEINDPAPRERKIDSAPRDGSVLSQINS